MSSAGIVCFHCLLAISSICNGFSIHSIFDENEVIKESSKLPLDLPETSLEAIYYTVYGAESGVGGEGGRMDGSSSDNTCGYVRAVPKELRNPAQMTQYGVISTYYQKYTESYNIPVVGSADVSDRALQRACYVLRFMLADRPDIRQRYYRRHGRVAVIGRDVPITSLPEYSFLPRSFDGLRGLGAIPSVPVTSVGEENVLCDDVGDSSRHEDVLVRELAEGILHLALPHADNTFPTDLRRAYNQAMTNGWWRNTYASLSSATYFAEGVQSYLNVNAYADPPNGLHNNINMRTKLRSYDTELYHLVHEIFPCANNFIKRCHNRGNEEYQQLLYNCQPTSSLNRVRTPQRRTRGFYGR